jgi:hypothetical protein
MALTINPAVSRTRAEWLVHILAFLLGSFVGALVTLFTVILTAMLIESLVPTAWLRIGLVILVGIAALHDLGLPIPLPYRQQQVPEWLRQTLPRGPVAFIYGLMLGVGVLTLFTYSTHVAMLSTLPFLSTLAEMIAVVALFAVGKTLVLVAAVGISSLDSISPRFSVSQNRIRLLRFMSAAVSLTIAALLVAGPK